MNTVDSEVNFDWNRRRRIGIGEAVLAEGKTFEQLSAIAASARERDASVLFTRLGAESAARIPLIRYDPHSRTGVVGSMPAEQHEGAVAIVTAGTSDAGVAREAERTLAFNGYAATMIFDVGVAGLHRLLSRLEEIDRHQVVIAVAGMDAALASVLAGQVAAPVIGVPTSTGYGAARKGETALASMLSSCAAGLSVVNVDNGFGAACAALRILHASKEAARDIADKS